MADRYERDRYDRERGYGREDRGMLDRAGDEVRSWFGDDEAARRRERDEREPYRRGEFDREYQRELNRPYGDAEERAWSGSSGERWREPERQPEDWRPRRDWNMAASRPARLEPGTRYGGGTYGGGTYHGGEGGTYASRGGSYGGNVDRGSYGSSVDRGFDRERDFRGGRFGGRDTSRDYPAWNYQNVGSAASDYGSIGAPAGWSESRGQFSGRGPKGYQRSDERIREDVCDRLADDPHLDASDIEITVRNGEVTLAGFVRDRHDKRHAEDVAEHVSGVREVNNSLRVHRGETNPGDVIGLNSEKGSGPITKK
jgi:osmotically-inducible protein OsmY